MIILCLLKPNYEGMNQIFTQYANTMEKCNKFLFYILIKLTFVVFCSSNIQDKIREEVQHINGLKVYF